MAMTDSEVTAMIVVVVVVVLGLAWLTYNIWRRSQKDRWNREVKERLAKHGSLFGTTDFYRTRNPKFMSTKSMASGKSVMSTRIIPGSGPEIYATPTGEHMGKRGIRVLCIDGGGMKVLAALEMLKQIEKHTKKQTWQLFDLICGSSTGGLLALALGVHHYSLRECELLFDSLAAVAFKDKYYVNKQAKKYNDLNEVMQVIFGDSALFDFSIPKVFVVSGVEPDRTNGDGDDEANVGGVYDTIESTLSSNIVRPELYLFRNYEFNHPTRFQGSSLHEVYEAALATSAAPAGYFAPFVKGDQLFIEGSEMMNNPCSIAVEEAKAIWGEDCRIDVVLSLGCGLPTSDGPESGRDAALMVELGVRSDAVHREMIGKFSSDVYFRLDPGVGTMHQFRLDETRKSQLKSLPPFIRDYLHKQETKMRLASLYIAMGFEVLLPGPPSRGSSRRRGAGSSQRSKSGKGKKGGASAAASRAIQQQLDEEERARTSGRSKKTSDEERGGDAAAGDAPKAGGSRGGAAGNKRQTRQRRGGSKGSRGGGSKGSRSGSQRPRGPRRGGSTGSLRKSSSKAKVTDEGEDRVQQQRSPGKTRPHQGSNESGGGGDQPARQRPAAGSDESGSRAMKRSRGKNSGGARSKGSKGSGGSKKSKGSAGSKGSGGSKNSLSRSGKRRAARAADKEQNEAEETPMDTLTMPLSRDAIVAPIGTTTTMHGVVPEREAEQFEPEDPETVRPVSLGTVDLAADD